MRQVRSCVNTCNAGIQSDLAAAEAGTECSEKREMCSVSFNSTVKPVDGTAEANFVKDNEMLMERNAEEALEEVPGNMLLLLLLVIIYSVCLTTLNFFVISLNSPFFVVLLFRNSSNIYCLVWLADSNILFLLLNLNPFILLLAI